MQTVVERGPDGAICIIVAKHAGGRRALLLAEAYQLRAKANELIDTLRQVFDVGLLRGDDVGLPGPRHILKLAELTGEISAERFRCRPIRGHVNAARFHHDGVDQPIDALEIDRASGRAVQRRIVVPGQFDCQ